MVDVPSAFHKERSMELLPLFWIISAFFTGLTKGAGVLPDGPLNKTVGGTVMFTTTLSPTENAFISVSWRFGVKTIITSNVANITAPEYKGRVTYFPSTGSLELRNLALNDSGEYTVSITPTGELQKDGNTRLNVYEKVSGVNITSTNLPIEGKPVNLTCEAAGSVPTRKWMKDGSDLNLADNITLHDENRVLSFHSLKKSDKGKYSCKVSNPVNSEEATFNMVVNYGPENVQITGPSEIHLEQSLTLTCSAESIPSASYIWTLNGTEIHNSAVFTKIITDLSQSGNYTCRATNSITEKTSVAVHELFVTALPDKSSGCSAGCIAGIVIACLVVCGAVAAAVCYYVYKKKKSRSSNGNTTNAMGQDNTAYSGNQELNYADIKFVRNKDGGTVQLGVQNNSSEYDQVRVHNNAPATSSPPTYDAHQQRMKRLAPQPDANGAQTYAQVRKN